MAPRRGGGSGGGSGVSSLEDTPWGQTTTLLGTDFQDAHIVARLVFQAIGLVGILVVIIAAKTFKKHHELNMKLFKWWAFWLSALALFVFVYFPLMPSPLADDIPAISPSCSSIA